MAITVEIEAAVFGVVDSQGVAAHTATRGVDRVPVPSLMESYARTRVTKFTGIGVNLLQ